MKVGDIVKFTYSWVDTTQPVNEEPYSECGVVVQIMHSATRGDMITYHVTNCAPDNRFNTMGGRVSQYKEDLELISESR